VPSGKKSKQARRVAATKPPPVVSKGGVRRRQANPRVLAIAAAVVVLAGIGIGLAVALSGSSKSSTATLPTIGNAATGLPGSVDIADELKGVPQSGMTLGSAKAPVTLTEYVDLQCPICREFETTVMPDVIQKYVKTGKLKVETRVLKFIGDGHSPNDSERGRAAMLAAADQNKAYDFALVLYANQGSENSGWLDDGMIGQIAASVPGMKVHTLLDARNSSSVESRAKTFDRQGVADKVPGTPTLYVGPSGTKGDVVSLQSATDSKTLTDAIDAALS
jgi:protein-disulfide isomerase